MKIKKVTFEHTGIFEIPVKDKWYYDHISCRYFQAKFDFRNIRCEICQQTETLEEWLNEAKGESK